MIGTIYVEFFRNIPLLSLLVLFIFGLPDAGVTIPLFASAAICLALSSSAFVCEAMRGGINSVSVGQAEAARAIGLSFTQVLRFVILPQAFRVMVQPLVNVFIGVLLSSALAAAVGVAELTNRTQQLNLQYAEAVVCFLFAGAVYLAISLAAGGGRRPARARGWRSSDERRAASSSTPPAPAPGAASPWSPSRSVVALVAVLSPWRCSSSARHGQLEWYRWQAFTTRPYLQVLGQGLLGTLKATGDERRSWRSRSARSSR